LANLWKDKSRKPRYAIVTWDNSYGRMFATEKVKNYIKSRGVEIVAEEYIPLVPTDTTPQMLRIKAKKADFIGGNMYYTAAAIVLKDMKKLGILDKVKVGFAYGSAPNLLVKRVGKSAEGLYFVFDKYYFGDEPQKMGLMAWKIFKEKNRARITTFEQYFPGGWFQTHVMAEAIRIAAADVGPKNVDGTAVYNAIQKIKNFDGHGTSLPVSFDNKSHFGTLNRAIITTIKNGKVVNLGEIPAVDLISN
jgi:ABC-type branched-subunit amino acid transport system substrate-binding protein